MSESQNNSLAFNLGAFFGHIVQAVKTDVAKQPSPTAHADTATPAQADAQIEAQVVRKQVGEARVQTQQGPVTLRRTIIDEVRADDAPRN